MNLYNFCQIPTFFCVQMLIHSLFKLVIISPLVAYELNTDFLSVPNRYHIACKIKNIGLALLPPHPNLPILA